MKKISILIIVLFISISGTAYGHFADELGHEIQIDINGLDVSINYKASFGDLTAFKKWHSDMDKDGNKLLSKEEKEEWAKLLKENILFTVNETPIELNISNFTYPVYDDFITSFNPDIIVTFQAELSTPLKIGENLEFDTYLYKKIYGYVKLQINTGSELGIKIKKVSEDGRESLIQIISKSKNKGNIAISKGEKKEKKTNKLWNLLNENNLLIALILAFIYGMIHALSPGHGKAMVGAYLIGTKGRVSDALILGVIVTFTHTFIVIVLSILLSFFQSYISEYILTSWFTFASGLLIVIIGLTLLIKAIKHPGEHSHGLFGHHHHHGIDEEAHNHEHDHQHSHIHIIDGQEVRHTHTEDDMDIEQIESGHDKQDRINLLQLIGLGISGGIVPCFPPIALLLIALASNFKIKFSAVLLVLSFSAGLAAVLIAIGIMMVKTKGILEKFGRLKGIVLRLPIVSAILVSLLGSALVFDSLYYFINGVHLLLK